MPLFYTEQHIASNHLPRVLKMDQPAPSVWVRRFTPLIRPAGQVLDLAVGGGRHTRLLLDMGFRVTAVDRDIAGLRQLVGDNCEIHAIDLEAGGPENASGRLAAAMTASS